MTPVLDKILFSAAQHFSLYGFNGSSLNAIAKEAGISKGAIFHYFGSKKSLATEVLKKQNKIYQEQIFSVVLKELSPHQRLKKFIKLLESGIPGEHFPLSVSMKLYLEYAPETQKITLDSIQIWKDFIHEILYPIHQETAKFLSNTGFMLIMGAVSQINLSDSTLKSQAIQSLKRSLKFLWVESTYL